MPVMWGERINGRLCVCVCTLTLGPVLHRTKTEAHGKHTRPHTDPTPTRLGHACDALPTHNHGRASVSAAAPTVAAATAIAAATVAAAKAAW